MKKIFTFILLGTLSLSMSAQKLLPNGKFDFWDERTVTFNEVDITTVEPDGWITPNYITNSITVDNKVCVSKGIEGSNNFVLIETFAGPTPIPSALTLGSFTLTPEFDITIGDGLNFAENTTPISSFTGKYKFDKKGNDLANIAVFGYTKNGNINDTVMTGAIKITETVAQWTTFTIDVKYKNNTPVVPQYVNIIAASLDFYFNEGKTIKFDFFNFANGGYNIGTKLSLDDFELKYSTVGVNNIIKNNDDFKIAVSNNSLRFIKTPELSNAKVSIYSITGQVVYTNDMNGNSIDLSNFNKGMYIIQLSDNGKNYTQKFVR